MTRDREAAQKLYRKFEGESDITVGRIRRELACSERRARQIFAEYQTYISELSQ